MAGCRAPPRGGVQPAAADGVPCRRQAAGQGRRRRRPPGRSPCGSGRPRSWPTWTHCSQDTAVDGACAPGALEDLPYGLTEREYEVLQQLGTGATNRQIARELFISERTVGFMCPVFCINSRSPTGHRPRQLRCGSPVSCVEGLRCRSSCRSSISGPTTRTRPWTSTTRSSRSSAGSSTPTPTSTRRGAAPGRAARRGERPDAARPDRVLTAVPRFSAGWARAAPGGHAPPGRAAVRGCPAGCRAPG